MFKSTELLEYLDSQGFTLIYLNQLKFVLKKFQLFLDKMRLLIHHFKIFGIFCKLKEVQIKHVSVLSLYM